MQTGVGPEANGDLTTYSYFKVMYKEILFFLFCLRLYLKSNRFILCSKISTKGAVRRMDRKTVKTRWGAQTGWDEAS